MESVETVTIYISKEEQSVIQDMIDMLDNMSKSLSNDDYVNIFGAIARVNTHPDDIDDMLISYE